MLLNIIVGILTFSDIIKKCPKLLIPNLEERNSIRLRILNNPFRGKTGVSIALLKKHTGRFGCGNHNYQWQNRDLPTKDTIPAQRRPDDHSAGKPTAYSAYTAAVQNDAHDDL